MINAFRRLLIRFGKMLPFLLCAIVFIAYFESLVALYQQDYLMYNDYITLNTPISFWVANRFEYDMLTICAATILSVAIQTCVWNKIALVYLTLHLIFKHYIESIELYPEYIYAIIAVNLLCSGFFVFKGTTILLAREKRL